MANKRFRLFHIDGGYVARLLQVDSRVMSVSAREGKENRPFVGIVVPHDGRDYCIPLSSPKPKHERMRSDRDFSKIVDNGGKLIGVLNFNNMIPVDERVLLSFDMRPRPGDSRATRAYKELLRDELRWCNEHGDVIRRKAEKLYAIVTEHPESARGLVRRCCDFRRLEQVLDEWSDR